MSRNNKPRAAAAFALYSRPGCVPVLTAIRKIDVIEDEGVAAVFNFFHMRLEIGERDEQRRPGPVVCPFRSRLHVEPNVSFRVATVYFAFADPQRQRYGQ